MGSTAGTPAEQSLAPMGPLAVAVCQFACVEDKEANMVGTALTHSTMLAIDPHRSRGRPAVRCLQATAERFVRLAAASGAKVILLQVVCWGGALNVLLQCLGRYTGT